MRFYFCETCGKRLTEHDVQGGVAMDKKLKGVYCKECGIGVTTMESLPLTDREAKKVLEDASPRPQKLRRWLADRKKGRGTPHAEHAQTSTRLRKASPPMSNSQWRPLAWRRWRWEACWCSAAGDARPS
jgi:DNA-directed RNA polymerase subunit RPC12/RpoP